MQIKNQETNYLKQIKITMGVPTEPQWVKEKKKRKKKGVMNSVSRNPKNKML